MDKNVQDLSDTTYPPNIQKLLLYVKALEEALIAKPAPIDILLPPSNNGWLPIESAPKDGSIVDLWAEGMRFADCRWDVAFPLSSGWRETTRGGGSMRVLIPATHFMLVPKGPEVER
jgi:hypothetical protein